MVSLTSIGIHGKPFVPWDGVRPDESTTIQQDLDRDDEGNARHQTNRASGYCSHSSNLFPTWHREFASFHKYVSAAGVDIDCFRCIPGNA